MTTPDTNTPRDGLTDADELVKRLNFLRIVTDADTLKQIRVLASAIAADREARPAPAPDARLSKAVIEFLCAVDEQHDSQPYPLKFGIPFGALNMLREAVGAPALNRLAAASTPPAEAQPVACQWCCGTGRFSDHACRFCGGNKAASEARATGDAAEWTIFAPDGSSYTGISAHDAANKANRSRRDSDPALAAQFTAMQEEFQRSSEAENARLIALHGSLDCPTCGGSGHVGDTQRAATGAAGEPQPREAVLHPLDAELRAYEAEGAIPPPDFLARCHAAVAAARRADSGAAGGQGDKP